MDGANLAYCREHDPILQCGFTVCERCGALSWPTDAEWIADGLIVATFPSACEHQSGATWVVDPAQLEATERCIGRTRAGTRCRLRSRANSSYCHLHGGRE